MRKVAFDEEKAKKLHDEGLTYVQIAEQVEGACAVTIFKRLNPNKQVKAKESTKRQRDQKKNYLLTLKGGKCCICDYNKCQGALAFHHLDRSTKSFTISNRINAPLEILEKEVEKTILVCNNCHSEIHAGMHEEFMQNQLYKYEISNS